MAAGVTILTQRISLADLLSENHTLRATIADFIEPAYQDARELTANGTRCAIDTFPAGCPWTATQIVDKAFLPE